MLIIHFCLSPFIFLSLIFVFLFSCCEYDCLCFCCHGCVVMKLGKLLVVLPKPVVETGSCFFVKIVLVFEKSFLVFLLTLFLLLYV